MHFRIARAVQRGVRVAGIIPAGVLLEAAQARAAGVIDDRQRRVDARNVVALRRAAGSERRIHWCRQRSDDEPKERRDRARHCQC